MITPRHQIQPTVDRLIRQAKILCTAALLLTPAFAQQVQAAQNTVDDTIATCIESEVDITALTKGLAASDWHKTENTDLEDLALQSIAADMMVEHMTGQPTTLRWESTWERNVRTAPGKRRLVRVEGAPSQTYFFVHANGGSALEVNLQKYPNYESLSCDFSVPVTIANPDLLALSMEAKERNMKPITPLRTSKFDKGDRTRVLNVTVFQPDAISDLIKAPFPYVAAVSVLTSRRLSPEVTQ